MRRVAGLAPRTVRVVVGFVALWLIALIPAAAAANGVETALFFQTPSKNIGCAFESAATGVASGVRCDIASGIKPAPAKPAGCHLDYQDTFVLPSRGKAAVGCVGGTAFDPNDQHVITLGYGHSLSRFGIACNSTAAGLRCRNESGSGFFMSRQHSYRFSRSDTNKTACASSARAAIACYENRPPAYGTPTEDALLLAKLEWATAGDNWPHVLDPSGLGVSLPKRTESDITVGLYWWARQYKPGWWRGEAAQFRHELDELKAGCKTAYCPQSRYFEKYLDGPTADSGVWPTGFSQSVATWVGDVETHKAFDVISCTVKSAPAVVYDTPPSPKRDPLGFAVWLTQHIAALKGWDVLSRAIGDVGTLFWLKHEFSCTSS